MTLREWFGTMPVWLDDTEMNPEMRSWVLFTAGWIWGALSQQQAPCLDALVELPREEAP